VDRSEKVSGSLVITCRNGTELLGPAEEILHQMACFIQHFVICSGVVAVLFRRDHGGFPRRLERFDHPLVRVISFVRKQGFRLHPGHQRIRSGEVVDLPRRQDDLQRITQGVHQNVDFGAQAAFAFPNGLIFSSFFLAPALC
jgi:hypothetical protein